MRFAGLAYRAHDPRWAFAPLSGEGASRTGGRFNPKGVAMLYLSLSLQTCIKEATQGLVRKIDPLTICAYEVDCTKIVDLTCKRERKAHAVRMKDLACAWKLHEMRNQVAPSRALAQRMMDAGKAGIMVRSFAPGATDDDLNLVLWHWGPDLPHQVLVHDPDHRLPQNQDSWGYASK